MVCQVFFIFVGVGNLVHLTLRVKEATFIHQLYC